ncbi:MAG: hypothetical protein AB1400_05805 [Pseudomonadota bacterium]
MARSKSTSVVESHELTAEQTPGITRAAETISAGGELVAQIDANVRAVAAQIGYQLPADCTDPDLIQRDISANMRRSVEACLEVGRGLAVLKAACGHGNFVARLDVLGVEPRLAQRFMASAIKFSNAASTPLLKAVGSQTKLFEMLVLDDEQIEELELTGQTGDLHLDKIATMSVKELRAALREAKADAAANDRVLEDNQKTITKLQKQIAGKQIDPQAEWAEAMRSLNAHVAAHRNTFIESVAALDVIREKVMEQQAEPGAEAALAAAREQIGRELAEAIQRAEEIVTGVRHKFDVTLGALID